MYWQNLVFLFCLRNIGLLEKLYELPQCWNFSKSVTVRGKDSLRVISIVIVVSTPVFLFEARIWEVGA